MAVKPCSSTRCSAESSIRSRAEVVVVVTRSSITGLTDQPVGLTVGLTDQLVGLSAKQVTSLITFALAVASVGLWTLRVALTARGSRALGSTVAAIEAMVFVVAFSHVTGSINAPTQVLIYGAGVGAGTYLGVTLDRKLKDWHPGQSSAESAAPGSRTTSPAGVSRAHTTGPGVG